MSKGKRVKLHRSRWMTSRRGYLYNEGDQHYIDFMIYLKRDLEEGRKKSLTFSDMMKIRTINLRMGMRYPEKYIAHAKRVLGSDFTTLHESALEHMADEEYVKAYTELGIIDIVSKAEYVPRFFQPNLENGPLHGLPDVLPGAGYHYAEEIGRNGFRTISEDAMDYLKTFVRVFE